MNLVPYPQFDFSAGVQDATTFLLKKPNELARGVNLRFTEELGGFERRPGFQPAGDPFSTVPNLPDGGHAANFTTGTVRMVAVNNDDNTATIIRTQNSDGTWTTLPVISYPVDSIIFFKTYRDEVYVSGFDPATGDPVTPYNIDKTLNVSATRNLLNAPTGYFFEEYLGVLYLANLKYGGIRYPGRVQKASAPLSFVTTVQGLQTSPFTSLLVDSVRYLKPGNIIDFYQAGTDTELYDNLVINSVDKFNNTITFNPYTMPFLDTAVNTTDNVILLDDAYFFPTGTPVVFKTEGGSTLPGGLTAGTTYYAIRDAVVNAAAFPSTAGGFGSGESQWTNGNNIKVSDGNVATFDYYQGSTVNNFTTDLQATNYGLAIPADAVITGIQAEINRYGYNSAEGSVRVLKAGVPVGSNKGINGVSNTATAITYGGPNDLWGTTWTPAEINAANFGLQASYVATHNAADAHMYVDYMKVTVYYSTSKAIKVATTLANANAGTAIDITSAGSGTNDVQLVYTLPDNTEIWLHGTKGKQNVFWNTDYPNIQSTGEFLDIKPGKDANNVISGIAQSSNRLFIFTKNSGSRYDGSNLVVFNNSVGCISHRSIANIDDDWLIWLDAKGNIRARNETGGQQEKISRPMRSIIRKFTQTQLKAANAGVVDQTYKLFLGTNVDGEYVRICYDFEANTWSPEKLGYPALIQFNDATSGDLKPYFYSNNGKIYVDETGNDDDDKTIEFMGGTGQDLYNNPQVKNYYGILLFTENCSGLKIQASVDGAQMKNVGSVDGKTSWIKFSENSDGQLLPGRTFDWQIAGAEPHADPPRVRGAVLFYGIGDNVPTERGPGYGK